MDCKSAHREWLKMCAPIHAAQTLKWQPLGMYTGNGDTIEKTNLPRSVDQVKSQDRIVRAKIISNVNHLASRKRTLRVNPYKK